MVVSQGGDINAKKVESDSVVFGVTRQVMSM